jgi:hypothetical protein
MSPRGILFVVGLLSSLAPVPAWSKTSPDRLYSGPIEFEILRNNTPVGTHRVAFEQRDDGLSVTVTSDIVVRFLAVPVYRFHYQSQTLWADGQLKSVKAVTNDDGDVSTVEAKAEGREAVIEGPAGRMTAPLPFFAIDHWNADELAQSVVLNNITGKLDRVRVIAAGANEIETADGPRAADRYDIEGDLTFTAWYDPSGRWIGLSFKGKDGSTIQYLCRRCGPERP